MVTHTKLMYPFYILTNTVQENLINSSYNKGINASKMFIVEIYLRIGGQKFSFTGTHERNHKRNFH